MYKMRGTLTTEILKHMAARTEEIQLTFWQGEDVKEGRGDKWFTFAELCEMLDRNKTGSMRRAVDTLVEYGYIKKDRIGNAGNSAIVYSLAFRAIRSLLFVRSGSDWREFLNSTGVWWCETVSGSQTWVIFPAFNWLDLLAKFDEWGIA